MSRRALVWIGVAYAILILAFVVPPAIGQSGSGLWFLPACSSLTSPNTGLSWCFKTSTSYDIQVWNGATWTSVLTSGSGTIIGSGSSPNLAIWSGATSLTNFGGDQCGATGQAAYRIDATGHLSCITVATATGGGGTPGGLNRAIQFNDSSTFGGANLWWDKYNNILEPSAGNAYDIGTATLGMRRLYLTGDSSTPRSALVMSESDASHESDLGVGILQFMLSNSFFYSLLDLRANDFPIWGMFRTNGTLSSKSVIVDGSTIGQFIFGGWTGAAFSNMAYVKVDAATGSSQLGGNLKVFTRAGNTTGSWTHQFTELGTHLPPSVTLSQLGSPGTNGHMAYCSDCDATTTMATCTSVGTKTGALAVRLNSAWRCAG